VALLVLGPERLPEALRTLGLWLGRMRRSFNSVKTEIEREIGMDEIRRQLHNESVMQEMKRIEDDVKASTADLATVDLSGTAAGASGTGAAGPSAGAADTEVAKPKPAETPAGDQADK
jgi:sec-independent protein translocase protein TatB